MLWMLKCIHFDKDQGVVLRGAGWSGAGLADPGWRLSHFKLERNFGAWNQIFCAQLAPPSYQPGFSILGLWFRLLRRRHYNRPLMGYFDLFHSWWFSARLLRKDSWWDSHILTYHAQYHEAHLLARNYVMLCVQYQNDHKCTCNLTILKRLYAACQTLNWIWLSWCSGSQPGTYWVRFTVDWVNFCLIITDSSLIHPRLCWEIRKIWLRSRE